jgi:hypothetical protein
VSYRGHSFSMYLPSLSPSRSGITASVGPGTKTGTFVFVLTACKRPLLMHMEGAGAQLGHIQTNKIAPRQNGNEIASLSMTKQRAGRAGKVRSVIRPFNTYYTRLTDAPPALAYLIFWGVRYVRTTFIRHGPALQPSRGGILSVHILGINASLSLMCCV